MFRLSGATDVKNHCIITTECASFCWFVCLVFFCLVGWFLFIYVFVSRKIFFFFFNV